jgi:hypothetical protein
MGRPGGGIGGRCSDTGGLGPAGGVDTGLLAPGGVDTGMAVPGGEDTGRPPGPMPIGEPGGGWIGPAGRAGAPGGGRMPVLTPTG